MIERIIDAIGRFLSSIFKVSGDLIDDKRTEYNMIKEQAKVTKINAQSTISVSIQGEGHVNYFSNRVVGEFLRVVSYMAPYEYEKSSGKYVVYFVRNRRKRVMEYVKFSKDNLDDKDSNISYTIINKIISSTGVTTDIGNTGDKILLVNDLVSSCIYDSIYSGKAPLYLVHILDDNMGIGNSTFIYECWITTSKLIKNKVNTYMLANRPEEEKLIETLMNQAGIHMMMSYFKSLNNPFYRTFYKNSDIETVVDAVKMYNSKHFNTNKILSFSYDRNDKNNKIEVCKESDYTILKTYGVTLKLTSIINGPRDKELIRFNYKFAECLLKADDVNLKKNFLFYMYSTGGIDDNDIVKLKEESVGTNNRKPCDYGVDYINNIIEPVVIKVMEDSNFKEDEHGDLVSMDFKEFIDSDIDIKNWDSSIKEPIITEPILTYQDLDYEDNVDVNKYKYNNIEDTNSNRDFVQRLEMEATGDSKIEREEDILINIPNKGEYDSMSASDILNEPIIKWTSEECLKVLGSDLELNNGITKQDILERMMFLSEKSK